jgi:hypothetical protein
MLKIFGLAVLALFVAGNFVSSQAQNGGQVRVQISKEKPVAKSGLRLRFLDVMEDSRCPKGANCIWAGNAKIKVQINKSGGQPKIFELNTGMEKQSVIVDGYEVKLAELTPYPKADSQPKKPGYTAVFEITRKMK